MAPWNGTGTYNVPLGFVPDTDATAQDQNIQDTDIAAGITNCMARDGQNAASANLSMGGNRLINLADGTSGTDAVNANQLHTLLPAGIVLPTAGTVVPSGFLLCDGSAVSRNTYSTLYSVIGSQFGNGDGVTTFNVPNLLGRVIAGVDPTGTVLDTTTINTPASPGGIGGASLIGLRTDQLPPHSHQAFVTDGGHAHSITDPSHSHTYIETGSGIGIQPGTGVGTFPNNTSAAVTGISVNSSTTGITVSIGNTGSNNPVPVVQPTMVMYYLIKT